LKMISVDIVRMRINSRIFSATTQILQKRLRDWTTFSRIKLEN
jgi:hypothetical protein